MRAKFLTLASLLLVASMILTACPAPAAQTVEVPVTVESVVEKEVVVTATPGAVDQAAVKKVLRTNLGYGDVPTLDPNLAEDTSSVQFVNETSLGLTQLDEETTAVEPGMAESWEISDDGLTYTFKIREGVPWVKYDALSDQVVKVADCEGNDRVVTAQDFEYSIRRALAPETASPYAYVLAFVIEGAGAYNTGEVTDTATVGVKAIDPTTLEIKFMEPAAYNLNIAGLWTAHAVPQWLIDGDDCTQAAGDRWFETGFNQGYGPFVLKEWVHDSFLTIIKNPFWPGTEVAPVAKIDEVTTTMLDDTGAMAEYEAGNQDDHRNVPLADMDRIKSDPVLSAELRIAPQLSTYYYGFNTKANTVDDVRVRRALSLAVDRQSLIDNVLKGEQEPAGWFCRPGLTACPTRETHPDLGVKFDPEQAKTILGEYLTEKGLTADKLDLTLMFNTSPGHQRIAEAIQQMWKDNLGVDVKLVNQEWGVYLETTKDPVGTPQIYRMGWNLDYPDANNFTREVCAKGGSQNPREGGGFNWENAKFEELVKAAAIEADPAKRLEMYAEAEQILVWEDAVMIPLYWYTRVTLTKPYVTRTFSNTGDERWENWDIDVTAQMGG